MPEWKKNPTNVVPLNPQKEFTIISKTNVLKNVTNFADTVFGETEGRVVIDSLPIGANLTQEEANSVKALAEHGRDQRKIYNFIDLKQD